MPVRGASDLAKRERRELRLLHPCRLELHGSTVLPLVIEIGAHLLQLVHDHVRVLNPRVGRRRDRPSEGAQHWKHQGLLPSLIGLAPQMCRLTTHETPEKWAPSRFGMRNVISKIDCHCCSLVAPNSCKQNFQIVSRHRSRLDLVSNVFINLRSANSRPHDPAVLGL